MKIHYFLLVVLAVSLSVQASNSDPEAVWSRINPSTNLSWVPCYTSSFECARFTVPLDYTTRSNDATMAIALVRLPSSLPKDDKNYRGPIIINPGGPGGSGIDAVVSGGAAWQQIIGNEYDIVGFDARAVGRTTPTLHAFTSILEASTFSIKVNQDPPLDATPDALARTYARFASFGTVAKARLGDIGPYVSTPFVARDMLAITKAFGFDKVKFWGISYSSVLGLDDIGGKNASIMLASLEQGDGSRLYATEIDDSQSLQCACDGDPSHEEVDPRASIAIQCSDGDPVNDTLSDLQEWFKNNQKYSSFADIWIHRIFCAGWKIRPAEKFEGSQIGGNTSFPILFISNTADPVAPLAGAKKMSMLFDKSVVLTIDTPGHTSFAATSTCNALAVRAYFRDGILPKPGTVCPIEDKLFAMGNVSTASVSARQDYELALAAHQLSKSITIPRLGLFHT